MASGATAMLLASGAVVLATAICSIGSAAHAGEWPNMVFVMTLSKRHS